MSYLQHPVRILLRLEKKTFGIKSEFWNQTRRKLWNCVQINVLYDAMCTFHIKLSNTWSSCDKKVQGARMNMTHITRVEVGPFLIHSSDFCKSQINKIWSTFSSRNFLTEMIHVTWPSFWFISEWIKILLAKMSLI